MKKNEIKTKDFSRRNFIKKSALITGGALSIPLTVDAMANVNNEKKLKIGVVGCGGRGAGATVQALKADPNTELVAMGDAFMDRVKSTLGSVKKAMENYNSSSLKRIKVKDSNKFAGFDAYKNVIDKVDVVILATPPGFRPYHFEYAVNAGKHVFMEKPLAVDVPGIHKVMEMARVADEKKLNVVVGLQRHYQNKYIDLKSKIDRGDIGRIVSGQVYWNSPGVWVRKRVSGQSEMEYQMRNWYYFNWLCGDHILEQHIHNIDVANWFIGEYPISAQGMGGRQVRNGLDHGEIYDHHFVEYTYPSGAVVASQCRHQKGTMRRVDEYFQGTKGSIITGKAEIKNVNGDLAYKYKGKGLNEPDPYQFEHDKLFSSIRNNEVISDTENGAKSTLTAIMGRMATYSGKIITLEDALKSKQQIMPESVSWSDQPPTIPDSNGKYPIPTPGVTKIY